jgi:hypothetical protein
VWAFFSLDCLLKLKTFATKYPAVSSGIWSYFLVDVSHHWDLCLWDKRFEPSTRPSKLPSRMRCWTSARQEFSVGHLHFNFQVRSVTRPPKESSVRRSSLQNGSWTPRSSECSIYYVTQRWYFLI